uniref:Uncharacterized protein n=1 Tax=Chromera velia CCMP2878 TaxID=1169474 RepID=A0A0G4HYW4_9ALVE|eukprot:Cvel_9581.t1-p1 / transcript=Cvel_9581.t1 / gene=Cvel_9581 / organism=Chromera_velia_CCMP2878 / gene_product=hypothetical protein / transcript_product=hypothetical protein / location=Cvel_scaffold555:73046-76927(+) / protein_length=747 / sequence_SO=supercontig / SO=protein_coding / is_pseudo=false
MIGAASDPGGRYRTTASSVSSGESVALSGVERNSVQTAPAGNGSLSGEKIEVFNRICANVSPDNKFHLAMARLCKTAFRKDFGVLPPDAKFRITIVKNASESAIDNDLLQADLLVLNPESFDSVGDKDFPLGEEKKMVRGGEPYFVPAGWTRAGVGLPDLSACSRWYVAFDGNRFNNKNALLKNGVLLPARVRSGGLVYLHSHEKTEKGTGGRDSCSASSISGMSNSSRALRHMREDDAWKVSQSVHYAALFAQPMGLERTYLQFMFQVLVDPSVASLSRGEFGMGVWDSSLPFDPNFPNERLACRVKDSGVIVTGLLFREISSHPFELTLQRKETVLQWKNMRSRSPTYSWFVKKQVAGQAQEEWVQFGNSIQELLRAQWEEGRAVSSPFRMLFGDNCPPEGAVWEVLFCLPILRRVDETSQWFTVGASVTPPPAPQPQHQQQIQSQSQPAGIQQAPSYPPPSPSVVVKGEVQPHQQQQGQGQMTQQYRVNSSYPSHSSAAPHLSPQITYGASPSQNGSRSVNPLPGSQQLEGVLCGPGTVPPATAQVYTTCIGTSRPAPVAYSRGASLHSSGFSNSEGGGHSVPPSLSSPPPELPFPRSTPGPTNAYSHPLRIPHPHTKVPSDTPHPYPVYPQNPPAGAPQGTHPPVGVQGTYPIMPATRETTAPAHQEGSYQRCGPPAANHVSVGNQQAQWALITDSERQGERCLQGQGFNAAVLQVAPHPGAQPPPTAVSGSEPSPGPPPGFE